MRFKDRTVLVTGGNSGIGRGIVHRFIAEGARVAFVGRDAEKGERVSAEVKQSRGDAAFFQVDLSQEPAVEALIEALERRFGRLDIVVNNAGVWVAGVQG